MRSVLLALILAACGAGPDPILRNVPQPKTSAVAGAAAAIAGAATLAAPEANKPDESDKPMKSGPNVPADVLDRLDEQDPRDPPAPSPSEQRGDPKGKKAPVRAAPKQTHPPQTTIP